jgi:hypothetical protein
MTMKNYTPVTLTISCAASNIRSIQQVMPQQDALPLTQ